MSRNPMAENAQSVDASSCKPSRARAQTATSHIEAISGGKLYSPVENDQTVFAKFCALKSEAVQVE